MRMKSARFTFQRIVRAADSSSCDHVADRGLHRKWPKKLASRVPGLLGDWLQRDWFDGYLAKFSGFVFAGDGLYRCPIGRAFARRPRICTPTAHLHADRSGDPPRLAGADMLT